MGMREWKVIVKTEKVIRCLPDMLYIKNNDGRTIRLEAKIREDCCEYNLPEMTDIPEIYILVYPYSIQSVYIKCTVDHDVLYEKLVSYDDVPDILNMDITKLIMKQLYKNE